MDNKAAASIGIGSLFVYSGIKGYSVLKAVQNVIQGKSPDTGQSVSLLSGGKSASPSGANPGGSAIAQAAVQYKGHCYVYGGAPGADGKGCWDCSSCCNYILNVRLGMAIPGGAWNPATHGPATGSYLDWGGAATLGSDPSQAQPGDLCVWQTHMGIAVGGGAMLSARDPARGTVVDAIAGPDGETLVIRRINSSPASGATGQPGKTGIG